MCGSEDKERGRGQDKREGWEMEDYRRKEKKKKWMEYFQWLRNKILAENAAILEDTRDFQIVKTKYKEITSENKKKGQPSKRQKENN